jgi:AcrR family transcriptional regulator
MFKSRAGGTGAANVTKGEVTRQHVLATALALFRRQGFARTTMRDIAHAAGLSLGAAYHYFPSKDALVMAYYEWTQVEHERREEAGRSPNAGASGAINGVLGGYLLLFPHNRVRVLVRGGITSVPAIVVLGLWIVIQLISQVGSIAQTSEGGGVAYMAHIDGFVAGLVLVKLFTVRRPALA